MLDGVEKKMDEVFGLAPSPDTLNLFQEAMKENQDALENLPHAYVEALTNQPGDLKAASQVAGAIIDRKAVRTAQGLTRQLYNNVAIQKAKETGATKGIWLHSSASVNPRHQHQQAHGHEFDLVTLKFLTGPLKGKGAGFTADDHKECRPGEPYGCKCTFKLVVDMGVQ